MRKNIILLGIIGVIAAILILAYVNAQETKSSIGDVFQSKPKIQCNVVIKNPLFSGTKIESANCFTQPGETCRPGLSLAMLSLLSNSGDLSITTSDDRVISGYTVSDQVSKTVFLCSNDRSANIEITEDGEVKDSRIVSVA